MEALSSLGINWHSLVSQIINFLILLTLLRIFLYKPIIRILEQRQETIKKGLEDAEKAKLDLEKAEQESHQIISKASQKAQEIIDSAKDEAKKEIAKSTEEAKLKSQNIVEAARDQAEIERNKIVAKAKSQIGELVIIATEKIIREKSDSNKILSRQ